MKGSYVLLIRLDEGQAITVGKLAAVYFLAGYYAYVGSARGGVEARVRCHLRKNKKRHWHIDYLLERASVFDVKIWADKDVTECGMAQAMESRCESIPGFGCSDCACRSHLFFSAGEATFKEAIVLSSEAK